MRFTSVSRDAPGGPTELRTGATLIHTVEPGANITLLGARFHPLVAVVTHPDRTPYAVYADGATRDL